MDFNLINTITAASASSSMDFSLINLFAVLVAAWVCGSLAQRMGYPTILGELLAGFVFGPPLLGWLAPQEGLQVLAEVGVYLLMLYIGMQVDHRELTRASWGGLLAATGGFVVPFGAGVWMTYEFGGDTNAALFMGLAMGVTALATKSRMLAELNLFGTRVANVTLAAALISDTAALIIFAGIIGFVETGEVSMLRMGIVTGKVALFFGVTTFLGLKVFPIVGQRLMAIGFRQRTANFTLLLLVGLIFAEMAELAGLHSILGAFLAGLFVREGVLRKKLSHDLSQIVHDLSIGFLAPVFFVTSGFNVDLSVFQTDLLFLVSVILVATVSKVVGSTLFYLPSGKNWREGFAAGLAMNGRGAVEIILAQIGLELGIIDQTTFSVLVVMAFVTTATVPIFLQAAVSWLNRRGELVREEHGDRRTIIFGAGPLGVALAKAMDNGHVTLIDRNREHCQAAERAGFNVLTGDALRYEVLEEAGAADSQRVVALSSNFDVNTLVAQFARENFRVPEVYSLVPSSKEEGIQSLLEEQGVIPILSDVPLADWERWITLGDVSTEQLQVLEPMTAAEAAEAWRFGKDRFGLAVKKKDGSIYPMHRDITLDIGDEISYLRFTGGEKKSMPSDRFDEVVQHATVLDLDEPMDKDALFEKVAGVLALRLGISANDLLAGFREREAAAATVLAPGIAVPHVEIGIPGRMEAVIIRSKEGVKFDDESAPVVSVFAIAASRDERTAYLRVLSAIAQIMNSSTFTTRWLELDGPPSIREFLRTAKRQRF